MNNKPPVVFLDLETTGLNGHGEDEIVEIGIVDQGGRVLMDQRVKPTEAESWPGAQQVHGISPKDVADCPTLDQVGDDFKAAIRGKVVAIYNASFDKSFIPPEIQAEAERFFCVMQWFRRIAPESRWRLQDAIRWAGGKGQSKIHSAVEDAQSTRAVFDALKEVVLAKRQGDGHA